MHLKRLAPVVLLLCCATASAAAPDPEVWVTIGTDALEPVRETFQKAGLAAPTPGKARGPVATLRVRESQLSLLADVMHEKFKRCAGFMTHDTEAKALAALAPAPAPSLASLVTYTIDNAPVVSSLIGAVQEPNIRSTISSLAAFHTRYYTSTTGVEAATWLKNQWTSYALGRSDVTVELYAHTWAQPSVILTIQGSTLANEVVVLGGHLDSLNGSTGRAPGADDDASGIATLTEVIRVALAQGYKPQRTVKFMAYAGEEAGLKGSLAIAADYKNQGVNVVGVLQLDMTNYKGPSYEMTLVTDYTNAAQNTFIQNLNTAYTGYSIGLMTCGYACSDHAAWHNAGFPASIPFEALMSESNDWIHSQYDTLENSTNQNATNALKFAKLTAAYLGELAKGTLGDAGPPDTTDPTVSLTAPTGGTVTGTVTLAANAQDDVVVSRVDFLVDGVVKGSDYVAPYSFAWDSTAVANGSHTVAARAYDGANHSALSASVTVTVANLSATATYDATLKAPKCGVVANSCTSGTLLNGRGTLGPEINRPNTIKSACADGSSGTYHADESVDRIKVLTVDGGPFAPGKAVKIETTVWAYASPSVDRLDLYYTANANNPVWTLIGTYTPPAGGAQTMTAQYTLPSGTLQAVRARFRYQGSVAASGCGTGSYDDNDDLIFAVGP